MLENRCCKKIFRTQQKEDRCISTNVFKSDKAQNNSGLYFDRHLVYKYKSTQKLRSICGKTHIIGMYKYNSKIEVQSRIKTISQLKNKTRNQKDAVNSTIIITLM